MRLRRARRALRAPPAAPSRKRRAGAPEEPPRRPGMSDSSSPEVRKPAFCNAYIHLFVQSSRNMSTWTIQAMEIPSPMKPRRNVSACAIQIMPCPASPDGRSTSPRVLADEDWDIFQVQVPVEFGRRRTGLMQLRCVGEQCCKIDFARELVLEV